MCYGEVRRWSHSSYTLLHDGEAARAEYALDLALPFGCAGWYTNTQSVNQFWTATKLQLSLTGWQSEFGGYTCYVANEEDEEVSADQSFTCERSRWQILQTKCCFKFGITAGAIQLLNKHHRLRNLLHIS